MIRTRSRPPGAMRRVNELISESLVVGGRDEPVPFFCECDDPVCYRAVWLSPARYAEETSDPQWLAVAAAHGRPTQSASHMPFALGGAGWR